MDSRHQATVNTRSLRIAAIALLLAAAIVYLMRLGSAPLYLAPDEVIIANDAFELSRSGRTLDGVRLPLYVFVQVSRNWFMPAIYYTSALFLQVLPLTEWSIRLPTALVALASMWLAFAVARKAIGDRHAALVAIVVLACAPGFFILSRYALDYTYPVPIVLAWLYCLLSGLERPRAIGWFLAAGLLLGIGWYTYISSLVMMPIYLLFSIGALVVRKRDWRESAVLIAGFVIPVTLFAVWISQHPAAFQQTAQRYNFVDPSETASASGILRSFDFAAMFNRYRNFFGIEFLFRLGDVYLPFSTRTTGVFVPASGLLLGAGAFVALARRNVSHTLILLGFLSAPLAASVLVEEGAIRRATAMLPFGALLASLGAARIDAISRIPLFRPLAAAGGGAALMAGLAYMAFTISTQGGRVSETGTRVAVFGAIALVMAALASRVRHGRLLLILNALIIVVQFAAVVRDYHGEYVSRLAPWLQGNIKGALTEVIDASVRNPGARIYFATLRSGRGDWDIKNHFLPPYWRFYATKLGREDLIREATFLKETDSLDSVPKGSLVLGNLEDPHMRALADAGSTTLADIPEVDHPPFFRLVMK
jgi:4-amino-4-deoxy-L-arabinose transferase-like glycosyltransferase